MRGVAPGVHGGNVGAGAGEVRRPTLGRLDAGELQAAAITPATSASFAGLALHLLAFDELLLLPGDDAAINCRLC